MYLEVLQMFAVMSRTKTFRSLVDIGPQNSPPNKPSGDTTQLRKHFAADKIRPVPIFNLQLEDNP